MYGVLELWWQDDVLVMLREKNILFIHTLCDSVKCHTHTDSAAKNDCRFTAHVTINHPSFPTCEFVFFLYVWAQMCWCECDGQVLNLVLISCFLPVFKFMLCNCSIWAVWKSVECSHYFTVIHKCFWIFGLLFDVVTDKFLRNGMLFIVKNMKTVMYVSPTIWVLKS